MSKTLEDYKCDFQDLVHRYAGDDHLEEFCLVLDAIIALARKDEALKIGTGISLSGEYALSKKGDQYSLTSLKGVIPYLERCTCPSGDGSLWWPCPKHPPEGFPS